LQNRFAWKLLFHQWPLASRISNRELQMLREYELRTRVSTVTRARQGREFLRRLDARIRGRIDSLRNGKVPRDEFLVFGARQILAELKRRGLALYLASGTDEPFVKEEAALLDIDRYFGLHIYGAIDDYKSFSKKMVIERILNEKHIPGSQLLTFGDGYVEIENTCEIGGLAVAVASDEAHNGSGRIDRWKRRRLLGVGAQVVIPDFRNALALLQIILDR
jgi:phosphoglycolate phosphatase-like HAD superfamily hydrolase